MKALTNEELRRVRLAGKIARVLRYFLYFVVAGVLVLGGIGFYILSQGG